MAASLQSVLQEAGALSDAMEARGPNAQQGRLFPLRRAHRRYPRRRQDRPALRRVRPPEAPNLQLRRRPDRRNCLEEPWRPSRRNVLDRRPDADLHYSGRHRLPLRHPRRASRIALPRQRLLHAQCGGLRILAQRRRLHQRGLSGLLHTRFQESEPDPARGSWFGGLSALYDGDRASVHHVWECGSADGSRGSRVIGRRGRDSAAGSWNWAVAEDGGFAEWEAAGVLYT